MPKPPDQLDFLAALTRAVAAEVLEIRAAPERALRAASRPDLLPPDYGAETDWTPVVGDPELDAWFHGEDRWWNLPLQ